MRTVSYKQRRHFDLARGFTLVELLVVISIIGILATLLLLQLNTARAKARDAQRISAVGQMQTALMLYLDDNDSVPSVASWDAACTSLKTAKYVVSCPSMGSGNGRYGYARGSKEAHVWADLENRAAALSTDSDYSSTGWSNAQQINGAIEAAAGAVCSAADDCIFDLKVE